jgi:quercetin dioxygenase-like cupin family protein
MTTLHAASGELINIRPFEDTLPQATSATLVKTDHLELLRLVLPAGKKLPQHHVASVYYSPVHRRSRRVYAHGRSRLLRAGTMLFLAPGEPHSVEAIEDSSILITRLAHRA